jgi:hypothetical protein
MNGPFTEAASIRPHETPGYCQCCGLVFDLHRAACPRCGRCPQCGSKKAKDLNHCPNCGHPSEEAKFGKLTERLDPGLLSNQRERRQLDESWQDASKMERLNPWKVVGVVVVTSIALAMPSFVVATWIHIPRWITMPLSIILSISLFRAFVRQTGKGRFQWLVRKARRTEAHRQ